MLRASPLACIGLSTQAYLGRIQAPRSLWTLAQNYQAESSFGTCVFNLLYRLLWLMLHSHCVFAIGRGLGLEEKTYLRFGLLKRGADHLLIFTEIISRFQITKQILCS